MNRSTVISMVQDLTEHKADRKLDFDNLFNLRHAKFVQEKPFWWRKKILSFNTQAGVPTYDLANYPVQGGSIAITLAQYNALSRQVQLLFSDPVPDWCIVGSRVTVNFSDTRFNTGTAKTIAIVAPGNPNAIVYYENLGEIDINAETNPGSVYQVADPVLIASDVESFIKATLWQGGQKLGELEPNFDTESISDAQESVATGTPSSYCIEPGSLTVVRLMVTPDGAYKFKASYWACPQPADDSSDDSIALVPPMYHHCLVSGLKMDVAGFLYGEKSNIFSVAAAEYQDGITKSMARNDFSAEKKLQFITHEEGVRSTVGTTYPGSYLDDHDVTN
jgi:hypothetical protein